MIICGENRLQIGERYRASVTDAKRNWHHDIPYVVLREASHDEYLQQCREHGLSESDIAALAHYEFHYDVSVD